MSEVALWYWQHGRMDYDLHDSEEEAASSAVSMVDAELAAPAGIQFPDGRMIDCDEWPAYDEANRRRRRMEDERAARKTEPPPTRKVSAPFGGGEVEVEAGTPEWLGVRSGESGG